MRRSEATYTRRTGIALFLFTLLSLLGMMAVPAEARKSKADLPNFHQVHPFLYRGGELSASGVRKPTKRCEDFISPTFFPN